MVLMRAKMSYEDVALIRFGAGFEVVNKGLIFRVTNDDRPSIHNWWWTCWLLSLSLSFCHLVIPLRPGLSVVCLPLRRYCEGYVSPPNHYYILCCTQFAFAIEEDQGDFGGLRITVQYHHNFLLLTGLLVFFPYSTVQCCRGINRSQSNSSSAGYCTCSTPFARYCTEGLYAIRMQFYDGHRT